MELLEGRDMEEKAVADARKFLGLITDPRICALVDLRKLTQSSRYLEAVAMATDHAQRHGDFNFLNKIFAMVDGTPYSGQFVEGLRSRVHFVITDTKPRKLKKATRELVEQVARKAASKSVVPQKIAAQPVRKNRALRVDKDVDLMDTRLRLPGSFGNGKRQ